MAIQIPSAAGFIPSESVLDGLAKVFELFGKEAKDRRAAAVGKVKADTNQTNVETGFIPTKYAQASRGLDIAKQNADTATAGQSEIARQFNLNLPLREREVADRERGTQNTREMFDVQFPREMQNKETQTSIMAQNAQTDAERERARQLEFKQTLDYNKGEADRNYNIKQDQSLQNWNQLNQGWQELANRSKLTDAQVRNLDDTLKEMVSIYGQAGMQGDKESARAIMIQMLRKVAPEAAAAMEQQAQTEQQNLQNVGTQQRMQTQGFDRYFDLPTLNDIYLNKGQMPQATRVLPNDDLGLPPLPPLVIDDPLQAASQMIGGKRRKKSSESSANRAATDR